MDKAKTSLLLIEDKDKTSLLMERPNPILMEKAQKSVRKCSVCPDFFLLCYLCDLLLCVLCLSLVLKYFWISEALFYLYWASNQRNCLQ